MAEEITIQKQERTSVRFADDMDARSFITDILFADDNYNFTMSQEEDGINRIEFENVSANPAAWVIDEMRQDGKEYHIHGFDWKAVA